MAFVARFGNLPVVASVYNAAGASSLLSAGYDIVSAAFPNGIAKSLVESKFSAFGNVMPEAWATAGKQVMEVNLESNNIIHPDTKLQMQCTGWHSAFGTPVADISYLPNPNISLSATNYMSIHGENGNKLYGGVILVYTDALGAQLDSAVLCFCNIDNYTQDTATYVPTGSSANRIGIAYLEGLGYTVTITTSDEEYGDESDEDGYGTDGTPDFDHHSDIIGVPTDPTVSTGSVGFMNVYHVASGALSTLGQYLFPVIDPTQWTDTTQVLRGIAGIFAYRDSVQYIVDLHAIPVAPTDGTSKFIKLGQLTTDISQPVCSSDYVNFDCGTISIPERFRNFLDYTEVTCKIYIPFFGFVDLKPEYWASGSIGLKYKFNVIDGSFMAFLVSTSSKSRLANTVIGQYSGSACLHLPVVAASYGSIVSGLISGSAAMATAGTKETSHGSVSGAMEGAMTAGNFQPKMSQSNDYNCSAAYLGCREAYLLIEYPVQSFSANYPHDSGLPANITRTIQSMVGSGYTVIESVDLSGLGITEAEITELKDIFAGGFYL